MRFGLTLPHYDYSVDTHSVASFDVVVDAAQRAEASGFDAIYVSDHVSLDLGKYGGPDIPFHSLDPLSTLAGLASITTTITLGTLVLCEALRHPVMMAAIAHTLADISSNRFVLGLGAGWYEPDYEIYGKQMPLIGERMTRLTESMRMISALLRGDTIDADGEFYSAHGATLTSPLAPTSHATTRVPLFIGGKGDRLLSIIARYAQGWNTCWAWTFDDYRERVDALHKSCEKYDRDPASIYQSLGLYCMVADSEKELNDIFDETIASAPEGVGDGKTLDEWRKDRLVGTTEEVAHLLAQWSECGVREIIINPGIAPFHVGSLDLIEHSGQCLSRAAKMADL